MTLNPQLWQTVGILLVMAYSVIAFRGIRM